VKQKQAIKRPASKFGLELQKFTTVYIVHSRHCPCSFAGANDIKKKCVLAPKIVQNTARRSMIPSWQLPQSCNALRRSNIHVGASLLSPRMLHRDCGMDGWKIIPK
jgi:hypothetical protein